MIYKLQRGQIKAEAQSKSGMWANRTEMEPNSKATSRKFIKARHNITPVLKSQSTHFQLPFFSVLSSFLLLQVVNKFSHETIILANMSSVNENAHKVINNAVAKYILCKINLKNCQIQQKLGKPFSHQMKLIFSVFCLLLTLSLG